MPNDKPYHKPRHQAGADVLTMACRRIEEIYRRFDQVQISFSGGKDSTVCLQLALDVCRKIGRLPVKAFFYDEECIPPQTVEYVERTSKLPDLELTWYCIPVEQRNACSRKSPNWWPWAEEDKDKWVRPVPLLAVTTGPPGFARQTIPNMLPLLHPPASGTACQILGIRTQESMTRYHVIASKSTPDAYLSQADEWPWIWRAYPIYDWKLEDVWLAPVKMGWDYNRAYDLMEAAGIPRPGARCSPPFGEQPIRRLDSFKTCWPGLWDKMCARVPGASTAARYANTELYGMKLGSSAEPPAGLTWRSWMQQLMDKLDEDNRREVMIVTNMAVKCHYRYTKDPVPDAEPHPRSGFCWRTLIIPALAGGNKLNRQKQKVFNSAMNVRQANGVKSWR